MFNEPNLLGIFKDGGYAEYATLRLESLVRVPEGMVPREAAPLMCAGVTVFSTSVNCMNSYRMLTDTFRLSP